MYVIASYPISYRPPVASPEVAVGWAFTRAWQNRSDDSNEQLRNAIQRLVDRLHANRRSPEESVIVFKQAVRRFGGMHENPSLAADHYVDGDECAELYGEAFTMFVNAYFSPAREPSSI